MLPILRRVVALSVLIAFAALFSGMVPEAYAMLFMGTPRVQVVPLVLSSLSGSLIASVVLVCLLVLTLLFGRVYCSWICPLGIMQDIVNRLVRPRGMKHARYTPNHVFVRFFFVMAAVLSFLAGGSLLVGLLDPYTSAALAFGSLRTLFAPAPDASPAAWSLACALILLGLTVPLGMAAWRGRLYCNTVCPVGSLLGLLARVAPFAPSMNAEACRRCGACLRTCKAHAIDLKHGHIDRSRCVGCYDCVGACPHHALTLFPRKTTPPAASAADPTRRALLGLGALSVASALIPLPLRAEGESEGISSASGGSLPILPPGAGEDRARFLEICTGCGLCIANCPTSVLRPSLTAHGWNGLLKPYLAISAADTHGTSEGRYCRFDCHLCSSLCPTGALTPLSMADKQKTRIALARHVPSLCIPWQTGYECGHCAEACPTHALTLRAASVPIRDHPGACTACRRCLRVCPAGAISLQPHPEALHPERGVAVVDYAKCIGCGACAAACRRHAIRVAAVQVPELHPELCIGCGACTAHCPSSPRPAIEPLASK